VKEGNFFVAIFILSELVSLISITKVRVIFDTGIQRFARCSIEYIHKGQELTEEFLFILEAS
jgi:hypothetical protein